MSAVIQLVRPDNGSCIAKTDNDLAVVFRVTDDTVLRPGESIDIELPGILESKLAQRVAAGKAIAVSLRHDDIHDLRTAGAHGVPSDVSEERMRGK
jgi:hypothetical protein